MITERWTVGEGHHDCFFMEGAMLIYCTGNHQHKAIAFNGESERDCPMCKLAELKAGQIADLKDEIEILKKLNADLREGA